jgi:hypothetical protein
MPIGFAGLTMLPVDSAAQEASPPAANSTAMAAFRFLQQHFTINVSNVGQPEPGLSRLETVKGDLCQLQCGFHYAAGLHLVVDLEFEFKMADVAQSTLKWEIDGFGRAIVSFGSTIGEPVFRMRKRTQEADVASLQPAKSNWSRWSEWSKNSKALCRSKPSRDDLPRVLKAFSYLATACGAKEEPF